MARLRSAVDAAAVRSRRGDRRLRDARPRRRRADGAAATVATRQPVQSTPRRSASWRTSSIAALGRARPIRRRWLEARLVDLARDRDFTRVAEGRGAEYGRGIPRDGCLRRAHARWWRAACDSGATPTPISRPAAARSCATLDGTSALKRAGALDFVDLLLRARDLVRGHDDGPRGSSSSASPASSSTSSRTPIRCRPRFCCCWPPTIPASATGARVRPTPGKLFIVGDPKQAIYRFRRADVGDVLRGPRAARARAAPRRCQLDRQLPRVPDDPAVRQRRVRAGDDRRSRTLQAGYVPLRRRPATTAATSRRSSRCRCRAVRRCARIARSRSRSRCPTPSAPSSTGW